MPGFVSNTDSWKTYFYVLAEAIADNAIDEAQARHNFMQYKLSALFDTTPRGVESFSGLDLHPPTSLTTAPRTAIKSTLQTTLSACSAPNS